VDKYIIIYSRLIKAIFKEKSSWFFISWIDKVKVQFDLKKLKRVIKEVVNDKGALVIDAFNNSKNYRC